MHVRRHREFFLSVGEDEQQLVFLKADCFSSAIQLFTRIGKFAGAKWNRALTESRTITRINPFQALWGGPR